MVDLGYTEESKASSYDNFKNWVESNKHAGLSYLENDKMQIRADIKDYYPEFKSAFVFLFDYSKEKRALEKFYQGEKSNGYKIGSYNLIDNGEDYHLSIRKKLESLGNYLKEKDSDLEVKYGLDTQPILDRDLAFRAGLGWFGKNSMLINKNYGSYFLIGSLLLNKKFNISTNIIDSDHCGSCTGLCGGMPYVGNKS